MKKPKFFSKKKIDADVPRKFYTCENFESSDSHEEPQPTFVDNTIKSSKYTVLNFLPKNLFEQFKRIANFYFLCLCIIHFSIDSPVSPITSLLPLVLVITITGIKQGYEDWKRHREDNKVNNSPTKILKDGSFQEFEWCQIKVGDIVKVSIDEEFPCDLLCIYSSNQKLKCEVTTANLDGETNLKTFHCPFPSTEQITQEELPSLSAVVECQNPHPNLYDFKGRLDLLSREEDEQKPYSLSTENLLLRGSRLKNTDYIYGIAIYTGKDTKMALNSKLKTNKFSTAERSCNYFLLSYLAILLFEVLLTTMLKYVAFGEEKVDGMWYLGPTNSTISAKSVFEDGFSFFILFSYIIPISLYVTLEMQKFLGTFFFQWDKEMKYKETGEYAICNTSDLNEELGQIQYLFTDKTGTLTENSMCFRQCSFAGVKLFDKNGLLKSIDNESIEPIPQNIEEVLSFQRHIETCMLLLGLCHTVQTRKIFSDDDSSSEETSAEVFSLVDVRYEYHASSPDEKALVEACERYGVVLEGEIEGKMFLSVQGEKRTFERLETLEFDSDRKMMSTIVRDLKDNQIWLLSKGAEVSIIKRCLLKTSEDEDLKNITLKHIDDFARAGLRTLAIARKKISEDEYKSISKKFAAAKQEIRNREKALQSVMDEVENNLTLLGATAVEDLLQDGVQETLESLSIAGIKVWVLTGDKVETAVNIAYLCGLFKRFMTLIYLVHHDGEEGTKMKLEESEKELEREDAHFGLVVDGGTLMVLMENYKKEFYRLCKKCSAVVCCRMSPKQKAEIVQLVKSCSKKRTVCAAVGDGANDVSMIQEAHIGLGIMGKEGRQAVRCSDFAFARFRYLQRAILVHGHWYYTRISTLIHYCFYKNVAFNTPQVFFAFQSAYSTQTIYDGVVLTLFNVTFTALPIIIYGLFEQVYTDKELLSKPYLYREIRNNRSMSWAPFIIWGILGFWHSAVLYYGLLGTTFNTPFINDGKSQDIYLFGVMLTTNVVFVCNLKLVVESKYQTWIFFGSIILTLVGFYLVYFIYCIFPKQGVYFTFYVFHTTGVFYFSSIILVVISLLPDVIIKIFMNTKTFTLRDEIRKLNSNISKFIIK